MPFQEGRFIRQENFGRDRDLGPPNDTISADKVDGEFDNLAAGMTELKTGQKATDDKLNETSGSFYPKAATDEKLALKFDKAGGTIAGPVTLGGKAGASKGIVASGTATFDFADGSVQDITVNGPVVFDFTGLPARGGALQINLSIVSGSITVAGVTWWEQGGGAKSTNFADLGIELRTGRPYRMIIEMVAGYRTGILQ